MVGNGLVNNAAIDTNVKNNIINLSSYKLNTDECELLKLGLSFIPSPHPKNFSTNDLLKDFQTLREKYIQRYRCGVPSSSARILDGICTDIVANLTSVKVKQSHPNLPPRLRAALKSLRDNEKIIISKADKGDAVVIMDVEHYTKLAWEHLSDRDTYCPLSADPTPDIVWSFNKYLQQCLSDRVIDARTLDKLKLPTNTSTQSMYFLPKVHKHPLKLRPIVSCTNGPTCKASGYLDNLLQPHMKRVSSYVQNSTEVVNTLSEMKLPKQTLICTLDIESLYTNVTHEQAISAFARRFSSHPKFVFLLDLLKFVLSNNVFNFDGRLFSQTCGIAMGTKLAPALATIVIADLEENGTFP